jgi:hypothetical protein
LKTTASEPYTLQYTPLRGSKRLDFHDTRWAKDAKQLKRNGAGDGTRTRSYTFQPVSVGTNWFVLIAPGAARLTLFQRVPAVGYHGGPQPDGAGEGNGTRHESDQSPGLGGRTTSARPSTALMAGASTKIDFFTARGHASFERKQGRRRRWGSLPDSANAGVSRLRPLRAFTVFRWPGG